MRRYCIVCEKTFGCIKGGIKHVCIDCYRMDACSFRDNINQPYDTGGICEDCWDKRHHMRLAIKVSRIIKDLKLSPAGG